MSYRSLHPDTVMTSQPNPSLTTVYADRNNSEREQVCLTAVASQHIQIVNSAFTVSENENFL